MAYQTQTHRAAHCPGSVLILGLAVAACGRVGLDPRKPASEAGDRDSGGLSPDVAATADARDGSATWADVPTGENGMNDFCSAWTKTVCAIEVDCCRARGFGASVDWCPVPSRPRYFVEQPTCVGKLVTPEDFDVVAAQSCVEIQPQLLAGCAPARRDSAVHAAAIASCERIAPKPLSAPGFCTPGLPCPAPYGMVSVCYTPPGSGGIPECSAPMPPRLEGEACTLEIACADGLVCGPGGTCTPPLSDGDRCTNAVQCRSGYCDRVCGEPPAIADSRCQDLERLARYALYLNVGNGSVVTVTDHRLVWLGYYGPRGEYLHHATKDGTGPVVHLAPQVVHRYSNLALIADDDHVYDIDKGVIGRIALADGSRQDLATVDFDGHLEAKDGDDLIVVEDYCNRMARVSVVDGRVVLHPGRHEVNQDDRTPKVAVDDQAIYCANGRRITRFAHNGNFSLVTEEAVSSLGWTIGLQAFGGRLYYWPAGDSVMDKGFLRTLDLGTGRLSLVTPPSTPAGGTIADSVKGLLFWPTANGIQQYAPDSGAAVLIELPLPAGKSIAMDEAFVYWIHQNGVYRWPRP